MYECPNCGSNLKFDIASQQLHCDSCSAFLDPYSVKKDSDAEETYESAVFLCPQCGGEMEALENSVVEYCIYCGGSNILTGRLVKQKRPGYLIPFKKTKEDCIDLYRKQMKKAIFAPSALKDPKNLENFKGIYVPFCSYRINQQGRTLLQGKKVYQEGNYTITEKYNLSADVDAFYRGFSHDASSGVPDDLTERIAPFDVHEMNTFTPTYLSGFYADTADVVSSIYAEENIRQADEATFEKLRLDIFSEYQIETPKETTDYDQLLHTKLESADHTMFPIWFFTYRNRNRIIYTAVNGQTGKVFADIPIDPKKYIAGSVLLAIPIFLILNTFFVLKPSTVLCLTMYFALAGIIYYASELKKIFIKENRLNDRGFMWRLRNHSNDSDYNKKNELSAGEIVVLAIGIPVAIAIGLVTYIFCGFIVVVSFVAFAVGLGFTIGSIRKLKKLKDMSVHIDTMKDHKEKPEVTMSSVWGFFLPLLAIFINWMVLFISPVNDFWYYGSAVFTAATVLLTFFEIIRKYNLLSTRKIPHFHDRGGKNYE